MYHTVYQTKNLCNEKTYIGVHSTHNLQDGYIGCGIYRQSDAVRISQTGVKTPLADAVVKYGYDSFSRMTLSFFETREEALEEEMHLVNKEWVTNNNNYNVSTGGLGRSGFTRSEEHTEMLIEIHSKSYVVVDMLNNKTFYVKNLVDWSRENYPQELYEEYMCKTRKRKAYRTKLNPRRGGTTRPILGRWFVCYLDEWEGGVFFRKRKSTPKRSGYTKNIKNLKHKNVNIVHPKLGKIVVENLYQFCIENELDYSNMLRVVKDKKGTHKKFGTW